MKKLIFLFLFISWFQISQGQSCLPEGIVFTTQAQIDSFPDNYPGCTSIAGDVKISGDDISNLAGLNVLDSIFGSLSFQYTNQISHINGLNNLTYIGGAFLLYSNEELIDFIGLENLQRIEGPLYLAYNPMLTSMTGLENLTYAGSIDIILNEALTSLAGLSSLDSINEGLTIEGSYMLADLTGLEMLTWIGGELRIIDNYSLSNLNGLENVSASSISSIEIRGNKNLTNCNVQAVCEFLSEPTGSIIIYDNAPGCDHPHEIADICGVTLDCLPFGDYYFRKQVDVDSFPSFFPDCHQLEGYISIESNNITGLDSLYEIDTIKGSLSICGNGNLSSLAGLQNLKVINGSFYLGGFECDGNGKLSNLEGLNNLNLVGENLYIMYNYGLFTLSGLDSLSEVSSGITLRNNASLKTLHGFEHLSSAGSLDIYHNISLLNLDSLQSLIDLAYIFIGNNPALFSINGIANINADGLNSLNISNNESLSGCNISSICDYLDIPGANVEIYDNAAGCNSREEVEDACHVGVSVSLVDSRESLVFSYPNPAYDRVTFDILLQSTSVVRFSVFNSLGQLVEVIIDDLLQEGHHLIKWSTENLSDGIYFYRLTTDDCQVTNGKLMVGR
jgi:hypothetical protein